MSRVYPRTHPQTKYWHYGGAKHCQRACPRRKDACTQVVKKGRKAYLTNFSGKEKNFFSFKKLEGEEGDQCFLFCFLQRNKVGAERKNTLFS